MKVVDHRKDPVRRSRNARRPLHAKNARPRGGNGEHDEDGQNDNDEDCLEHE
jgi:hypothetical protein